MRLATNQYKKATRRNMHEIYTHLTNYSLNKHMSEYEHNDDPALNVGSKRTISAFFAEQDLDEGLIWDKICSVSEGTLCALQPLMRAEAARLEMPQALEGDCFNVFGLDMLITDDAEDPDVLLLEVNRHPSMCVRQIHKEAVEQAALDDPKNAAKLLNSMHPPETLLPVSQLDYHVKGTVMSGVVSILRDGEVPAGWIEVDSTMDVSYIEALTDIYMRHTRRRGLTGSTLRRLFSYLCTKTSDRHELDIVLSSARGVRNRQKVVMQKIAEEYLDFVRICQDIFARLCPSQSYQEALETFLHQHSELPRTRS